MGPRDFLKQHNSAAHHWLFDPPSVEILLGVMINVMPSL